MNLNYNQADGLGYHFYQHMAFGLKQDIPRFGTQKDWVEKVGDLGLWTLENFPGKVWSLMKEPRWITIVLTNLSLSAVSYAFYPQQFKEVVKAVIIQLPVLSRETVKFGVYITLVAHIVSSALRAYGRFRNDNLMQAWYRG